ncbi:ATP-binding cassette domain-containing protein [Candidatus Parcubacteria bacterium]|nr:ATP-binding cassette domain-containing protein [Patescibacteria group bacterium]MBU4466984.1 ATP-binding cassette domain-containing protein [Patescibacteria group bacterium]MCG2688103.1 ATP-binding cassette domain-containing protein [Candidatus Parcubacteria bacterium]
MIRFQGVNKIYPANNFNPKPTEALKDISFEINDKEFVLIAGRSGSGKTTIIKMLIGEERPSSGRVFFSFIDEQKTIRNIEVNKLKKQDLPELRRQIGVVFQDYKLLPRKTVFENVAYALEVVGASDKQIKDEVPKALKIVGLESRSRHFPSELSGGEKQRVAIARALIHRPKLIIADEPTGNLDPYHTWDIIKLLLKINELGETVILATHDQDIVNNLEKRVISLEDGRLLGDAKKGKYII